MRRARLLLTALLLLGAIGAVGAAGSDPPGGTSRFHTSRSGRDLPLPDEAESFVFAVLGDRTGGPPEGVEVLRDAVADLNVVQPDLVMTVGDLIQGYNATPAWMAQMREFRSVMDGLVCPWFPVAGNHDVYWRGEGKPPGEHEANYEVHFGPLWYAFAHKDAWFIALYSDEGDPVTGLKTFERPASQVMSDAQFTWLAGVLEDARDARHVFVFVHHPRWLGGGYGRDWERVHALLASAGNVRAVFAGHIHRMRYDGPRDGIEYVTLATTGGTLGASIPEAGYLHHFDLVTVRPDRIALATVPVGEVIDTRAITGTVSDETRDLARRAPVFTTSLDLGADGRVSGRVTLEVTNSASRPVDVTARLDSGDSRWHWAPDHRHVRLDPGDVRRFEFDVARDDDRLDDTYRRLDAIQQFDYLAEGARIHVPESHHVVPVTVAVPPWPDPVVDRALDVDGDDVLVVESGAVTLPDGPMTVECRLRARRFAARTGVVNKTENAEYGFFVNDGVPSFLVFLGPTYAEVRAEDVVLVPGRWHHLAGVFDGREVRLYVDGVLAGRMERQGARRTNGLPLLIGADVDGAGRATSHFDGLIDDVRLSSVARYAGDRATPPDRHVPDADTVLLLDMDHGVADWVFDASGREAHATRRGDPVLVQE